ncbi:MAG: DUF6090 family protein [Saprospiraceae bacterium]
MIKLFRKIRQNLLNNGQTTKYLKYAIGEIVLVVLGILIALSINNWNEQSKERKQSRRYLTEIMKDLGSDTFQFDYIIKSISEVIDIELDALNKIPYDQYDINKIRHLRTGNAYRREINQRTFQKIQNTGNSNLLGFETLYDSLSFYYIETNRELTVNTEWQLKNTDKDHQDMLELIKKGGFEVSINESKPFLQDLGVDSISVLTDQSRSRNEMLKIISSLEGRNIITNRLVRHLIVRNKYRSYKKKADSLIDQVSIALKKDD